MMLFHHHKYNNKKNLQYNNHKFNNHKLDQKRKEIN